MRYTWQYYDLVLAGIIGSLAAGVLVGLFTSIALTTSLVVFSFFAAAMMGHGLFINGPVDEAADITNEVDALN